MELKLNLIYETLSIRDKLEHTIDKRSKMPLLEIAKGKANNFLESESKFCSISLDKFVITGTKTNTDCDVRIGYRN